MTEDQNNQYENPQQSEPKRGALSQSLAFAWEIAKILIIALAIVLPIRYFLFQPFIVKGDSMVPNFHEGNYLIIDEITYRLGDPKRGDVVVLKYPLDNSQRFIKRIIGLPGETVEIRNGKITIVSGGEATVLDEQYLPDSLKTEGSVYITLSDDQYFVLGDNRQFSYDSRGWGVLPRKDIIGRAVFRLLPIDDFSYITAPNY